MTIWRNCDFKNMSAKSMLTHPVEGCQGKGAKKCLCCVPHYCIPGLNTYLMNSISNSDDATQYYSAPDNFDLPVPYVTFLENESRINAVLDIVNLKTDWNIINDKLLKRCRTQLSNSSTLDDIKTSLNKDKVLNLPNALLQFSLNQNNDPDQYFDSDCNWYFKNTIEKFEINGKWYLACARGVNLDILDIISINNNTSESTTTFEIREDKFFKGSIYDIKYSHSNDLMIRQKTKLFVFPNNFETGIVLNNDLIYDNCDIPFADADITFNNMCTVDVKHVIKLWKDRNCIQDKYFDVVYDQTDSFIHLSYLQNQTDLIAIINRQKVFLIDPRIDISKPCSIYDPSMIIEQCEELSALKNSNLNIHSLYVASNHSVLTLDNRMGFVHKCYHMLSNPPSLITTHCYENGFEPNEILILGNQTGEGLVNLSYTSSQENFLLSQKMVSSIPKPIDTLCNVRFRGHCLNPILLDRLSQCLIGTTTFGENITDLKLFSINSVGDLFVQQIGDITPVDVIKFKEMVTIKSKHSVFNHSNMYNMNKLWQLKPSDDRGNDKKISVWSMSRKKMTSYVDHLASLILYPWDIDDLSEWENEDENADILSDGSDCDYITKVHYWFNKNDLLLGSVESSKQKTDNPPIDFSSQTTTLKPPLTLENDEDSSSVYTVSLKSDNE